MASRQAAFSGNTSLIATLSSFNYNIHGAEYNTKRTDFCFTLSCLYFKRNAAFACYADIATFKSPPQIDPIRYCIYNTWAYCRMLIPQKPLMPDSLSVCNGFRLVKSETEIVSHAEIISFHSIVLFQATRPIQTIQKLHKQTENQYREKR